MTVDKTAPSMHVLRFNMVTIDVSCFGHRPGINMIIVIQRAA